METAAETVAAAGMALPAALVTAAAAVQEAANLPSDPAADSAPAPATSAESVPDRSAAAATDQTAAAAASLDVATQEAALPNPTTGDGTRLPRRTVQVGDTIILEVNGERQSFVTVREDGCVSRALAVHAMQGAYPPHACMIPLRINDCELMTLGIGSPLGMGFNDHAPAACRKVRVGKVDCSIATFVGAPYGAVYQLDDDGQTLSRTPRRSLPDPPPPPVPRLLAYMHSMRPA